jgi:glyoxylase-like metal-dependent hydrolase (beta-lactamase superfamily II)
MNSTHKYATQGQVPGIYRTYVGRFEVTCLLDGYFDLDMAMFPTADPAEIAVIHASANLPAKSIQLSVNAFLINTGEKLILVDAGTSTSMMATLGRLESNLLAAGIENSAIDIVLITHMHPDHINGITKPDGAAAFPNAQIYIGKIEWDFWTDPDRMNDANEHIKTVIQMNNHAVKPYQNADRITLFDADANSDLLPGIRAWLTPGHTPGHISFLLEDGGEQLLIWGDVLHLLPLQLIHPEWHFMIDSDPVQSGETRKKLFAELAEKKIRIAGAHVPYPGLGYIQRDSAGFQFIQGRWDFG